MIYTVAGDRESTLLIDVLGPRFREKLRFVPHYGLVECQKYVCFHPLISTYALNEGIPAPIAPHSHALDLFHGHILTAAAERRCILVFDASAEGDPLYVEAYRHLAAWLESYSIPQSQVLIVNQNRELSNQYNQFVGGSIRFSCYDYFVKELLNIFSKRDHRASVAPRSAEQSGRMPTHSGIAKTFLSLNGAPRAHRVVFVAALSACGLLDDTVWSMLGEKSGKLDPSVDAALAYRDMLELDWVSDRDIVSVVEQMPKLIAEEFSESSMGAGSNALALTLNSSHFDLGYCSLVTETEFSSGAIKRVSEKSLKPFGMGRPAIICGNPGSLALVRSFGFETFSPYIDESYDEIADPARRLAAIISSAKAFVETRAHDRDGMERIEEICARNVEIARDTAIGIYENNVETHVMSDIEAMFAE